MIKHLKTFTIQLFEGANIATIIVMVLVGYSDRIDPTDHPMLSTVGMTFPFFLLVNLLFLFFWLIFKWTKIWIPVLGFVVSYVPISIYMPLHTSSTIPDSAIKFISYNVCGYGGNHHYDNGLDAVTDYISEQKADIVCLQEDTGYKGVTMTQAYNKLFPYNDTIKVVHSSEASNSVGIHSRYPIIRREEIHYPSDTNGSAAWWLKVDNDTLIVINNHFESCHLTQSDRNQYRQILHGKMDRDSVRSESHLLLIKLAEANAKRALQIKTVSEYIRTNSNYPIIVCGDFNDNPISFSRYTIAKDLTDCFVAAGSGIGLSYNQKAFSFRIDHIFCSDHLIPVDCKVDSKMNASDHYPVLCWLKWR